MKFELNFSSFIFFLLPLLLPAPPPSPSPISMKGVVGISGLLVLGAALGAFAILLLHFSLTFFPFQAR